MTPPRTGDPLVAMEDAWSALTGSDPAATVFHDLRFLGRVREHLGTGAAAIEVIEAGGEPIGACGFEIDDGTLRFLGHPDVTDYRGPVGLPGRHDEVAEGVVSALLRRDDWERADLGGLSSDGTWLPALEHAAIRAGLKTEVADETVAPFLELERTFEGYLDDLSPKLRHEIRRKRRRMLEAFPDAQLVDVTTQEAGRAMDRFVELHRASPGPKGSFLDDDREALFRGLVEDLLPDGTLKLSVLQAGGAILAATIGFRDGHVFRLYNSAFDRDHAEVSPGMVLLGMLIEDVIGEGFRAMDLLRDDLEYKYRFGARPRGLSRLLLGRP